MRGLRIQIRKDLRLGLEKLRCAEESIEKWLSSIEGVVFEKDPEPLRMVPVKRHRFRNASA